MLRITVSSKRCLASASSSQKAIKDPLVATALEILRNYKPTEEKITDPVLLKKLAAPTPPPVEPIPEVTKEELEAYSK